MGQSFRSKRLSFAEQLGAVNTDFKPDPGPWKHLRGMIWLSYIVYTKGWSWQELARQIGKNRTRSNLVARWLRGEVNPSSDSADKLIKPVEGSKELFDNPVWELLANRPMRANRVKKLTKHYFPVEEGFWAYQFPELHSPENPLLQKIPLHTDDSMMLYMRGDIHAFALTLALIRTTEDLHRDDEHSLHVANLYRLLPAIGRLPYIRPHFSLLREMVTAIHSRVLYSHFLIGVDWPLISEQMVSEEFYTGYPRIPRDEMTPQNRIQCDPVIEGDFRIAKSIPWPDDIDYDAVAVA